MCSFPIVTADGHWEHHRSNLQRRQKKPENSHRKNVNRNFHSNGGSTLLCVFVWFCAKWPNKPRIDTHSNCHSSTSLMRFVNIQHSAFIHINHCYSTGGFLRSILTHFIAAHGYKRTHTHAVRLTKPNIPNVLRRLSSTKSGSVVYVFTYAT